MECPSCQRTNATLFGSKNSHDLYQCQHCTLIYMHPMPSTDALADYYHNYHKTPQYTRKLQSKQRRAAKRIWSLKRLCKGKRFIDIGCNAGFAVEAARSLGLDALGIDLDNASIDFARRQYPLAKFQTIAAENLASQGESFDIIYCCEVIEHLANPHTFLDALYAMLNDGGVLFLTTPDIAHFSVKRNLLEWTAIRPPEHLLYFAKASLKQLLEAHQFSKVNFRPNFKPTLKVVAQKRAPKSGRLKQGSDIAAI
ncbi:class I SAM-dependent methyltransferase [Zhongshania guokunii]|uniref:Class I SAM-dependent methyltransferase n=1 Tax=Zhongshania guokunii TaxID=641783 RepID=A0ABV3U3E3_9GAMM